MKASGSLCWVGEPVGLTWNWHNIASTESWYLGDLAETETASIQIVGRRSALAPACRHGPLRFGFGITAVP